MNPVVSDLVKHYVEKKWKTILKIETLKLEKFPHDIELVPGYSLCSYLEHKTNYHIPLKTDNDVMFWHRYAQVCRVISKNANTYYNMIIYNAQLIFNGVKMGEYGHNRVHSSGINFQVNFISRLPRQARSIDTVDPDIIRLVVMHPSFQQECVLIQATEKIAMFMEGFPYSDVELLKVLAVFVIAEKIHYQSVNRPLHKNRYLFLKTIMEYFADNHTLLHGVWTIKLSENLGSILVIQERTNQLRHQTLMTRLRDFIHAKQTQLHLTL